MDAAPLVLGILAILAAFGALASVAGTDSRDDFADRVTDIPRRAL